MPRDTKRDGSEYRRRTVLRTVGGSSAIIGLSNLLGTAGAQSGRTLIVTHKRGDKPIKTKSVPKEWKNHADNASQAKSEFVRRYSNRDDVKTVSLMASQERYGGKRGFNIHARVTTDEAKQELPDSVRGVPTAFSNFVPIEEDGACYNTGDWDDCPGGVTFDGNGTSGSQYYYDTDGDGFGEPHILTAAHLFGDPCDHILVGKTADQTDDEWGTVEAQSGSLDAVVCSPNSGYGVDNHIIYTETRLA